MKKILALLSLLLASPAFATPPNTTVVTQDLYSTQATTGDLLCASGGGQVVDCGGNGTTAPTADGAVGNIQNGSKTAYQIYGPAVPAGWFFNDVNRSVLDLENAATVQQSAAFGAYVYNNAVEGSPPNVKAAIGLYADGVDAVNGATTWGINTSCSDTPTNGLQTVSGRKCIGYEIDLTANGASTFEGLSLILQGPGTPAGANAVQVSIASGSTAIWSYGYLTDNGASTVGAQFGALATTGANTASQPLQLGYFNASNVDYAVKLQGANGGLNVTSTELADGIAVVTANGGNPGISAIGSDTNINLNLTAKAADVVSTSPFKVTDSTASTSTATGAMIDAGGLAVAKAGWFGTGVSATGGPPAATVGYAYVGGSSTNGGIFGGDGIGGTNDFALENSAGAIVARNPTGTTNLVVTGSLTGNTVVANSTLIAAGNLVAQNNTTTIPASGLSFQVTMNQAVTAEADLWNAFVGGGGFAFNQVTTSSAAFTQDLLLTASLATFNGGVKGTSLTATGAGSAIAGLTVTSAFTATGLVTNADLANASVTVGTTSIALGASSLTIGGLTSVSATTHIAAGSVPTGTSGSCTASSFTGGATAGKFTAPSCVAGTIILSAMPTAPNGYQCDAKDMTTPADLLNETANTATSVTFAATTAASDAIVFKCMGY